MNYKTLIRMGGRLWLLHFLRLLNLHQPAMLPQFPARTR